MRTRALAAAVALLLVAGLLGVAVQRDDGPSRRLAVPASTATTTAPITSPVAPAPGAAPPTTLSISPETPTTAPPSPDAVLIRTLESYVERTRGLTYKAPVTVTLLADAPFNERFRGEQQPDRAAADKTARVLRALGLLRPGVDLVAVEQKLLDAAILGYYSPKTKELVVRGADLQRPEVRQTLVHELTHALQDQWFNLSRPELDKRDDESADAFGALVEGDAVRVEELYHASLSASDRSRIDKARNAASAGIGRDIPPVLGESLSFPYLAGPPFTRAVVAAGTQSRLDASFTSPPTTTHQVLHPDRFLAGEQAATVDQPVADGPTIDHGIVGELGLLLILEGTAPGPDLARSVARWSGDSYVAWDAGGGRTCLRAAVTGVDGASTRTIGDALRHWASGRSAASVSGATVAPVTFTSCG